MSLRLVTPGTATVVSMAEAKAHLRVFHSDDDDYIADLVASVQDWLGGENSWLGRSVIPQVWELTLCAFPAGRIDLPRPPLVSVQTVRYTPVDGIEVALTGFRTLDVGVSDGGFLLPALNGAWPVTNGEPGSVRTNFTCGYATVPPSVKRAALLLIGHWYENREAAGDVKIAELPMAVDALLFPYRNWQI